MPLRAGARLHILPGSENVPGSSVLDALGTRAGGDPASGLLPARGELPHGIPVDQVREGCQHERDIVARPSFRLYGSGAILQACKRRAQVVKCVLDSRILCAK